jgi:hypothetical protein
VPNDAIDRDITIGLVASATPLPGGRAIHLEHTGGSRTQ